MTVAIVVHGGAWEIPDRLVTPLERGLAAVAERGHAMLKEGAAALDVVEAVVKALEDDPIFDAGFGAYLNRDGVVELDAGIMDGATLASGAVAGVTGIRNPVALARRVLDGGTDRLVVGPGAETMATELGVETVDPFTLASEAALAYWKGHQGGNPREIFDSHPGGTVGCVALDDSGELAAATSTGGLPGKRRGRVGDSPLVGCGFFADSVAGGASATGDGEAIMTVALTRLVVEHMRAGESAAESAKAGIAALAVPRVAGVGGVIALDESGRASAAFNTSRMARAWIDATGRAIARVDP